MTTRNAALFNAIADQIEAHPESYDQGTYGTAFCGTAHCIGGWAIALSGWARVLGHNWGSVTRGGVTRGAFDAGRDELGLDEVEAGTLFRPDWEPPAHETVPQALRRIGAGGAIVEDSQGADR